MIWIANPTFRSEGRSKELQSWSRMFRARIKIYNMEETKEELKREFRIRNRFDRGLRASRKIELDNIQKIKSSMLTLTENNSTWSSRQYQSVLSRSTTVDNELDRNLCNWSYLDEASLEVNNLKSTDGKSKVNHRFASIMFSIQRVLKKMYF